ncbi:hypothetical protein OCL06_10260 [Alteromonas sp. ASW11-19]|uniref:Uncharacterized protein n=1 Tax=Alteromonas salexigens TaxID=2982530 RepID=A0ABT2VRE5_9ALTE|nr:hypothetical protein [Alteromonas salexigens]MCU7554983.1 hypothetical protein [Alteromonas salexigens]
MNANDLNHSYTPAALREINESLSAQLEDPSASDVKRINALLKIRDEFIAGHLEVLDAEKKQAFANAELSVNNRLKEVAQTLLQSAKDDVSQFVRSRAAAKKYE